MSRMRDAAAPAPVEPATVGLKIEPGFTMQSKALSVAEYLEELSDDRRAAIEAVRKEILANLDRDYEEGMQYGMIGYYVPHRVYPSGYHCDPRQPLPFAALASQKNYMSLYLMCVYGSPELRRWFQESWTAAGKKLDMGKSCIRFKTLDDVALDVIGQAIRRVPAKKYITACERAISATRTPARNAAPKPHERVASKPGQRKTLNKTRAKTTRSPRSRG